MGHRILSYQVVLASALFLLPAVHAQPNAESEYRIDDPSGDGQVLVGLGGPVGNDALPSVDLLSFQLTEDSAGFTFRTESAPGTTFGLDGMQFVIIDFLSGGQAYRIKSPPDEAGVGAAALYRVDASGGTRLVEAVTVDPSGAPDAIGFLVPREILVDGYGAAPGPGSVLSGFRVVVTSSQVRIGPAPFYTMDALPNNGLAAPDYAVRFGLEQLGTAQLTSLRPVRASNGEEATFVFSVMAHNLGSKADVFSLNWSGAPASWQISTSRPVFHIPPQSAIPVNIVVSVPFAHQHGEFDRMRLMLTQTSNPASLGQVDLGIRYHEVPQPAGHHAHLTFHSKTNPDTLPLYTDLNGDGSYAYMNTLDDDPESDEVPVVADASVRPITNMTWRIRLEPSLDIGLQLDPSGEGRLQATVQSPLPIAMATLDAELFLFGPVDGVLQRTTILTGASDAAAMLTPDQPQTFELSLKSDGGRHPFSPGSELYLELTLRSEREVAATAAELPELLPGGFAQLPILEYRDSLEDILTGPAGFSLASAKANQRIGNPGDAFVFVGTLTNQQSIQQSYDLRLEGANVAWAEMGSRQVQLDPGQSLDVPVVVRIPQDATGFQVCDILLIASPVNDAGNEAILRFLTQVDRDVERSDDSASLPNFARPEKQESPGVSIPTLIGVLVFGFLAQRKLRR